MRIALVTPSQLPFSCGNSLLAERLRRGLTGLGHEVSLFSIYSDRAQDAAMFKPDIVHSLHAIKPAPWLADLFAQITAPWVITLTGTDYNSPEEYGAEQAMLVRQFTNAQAVVVFHEEARRQVAERFVQAAEKLFVIPQGIDVPERAIDRAAVRRRYGVAPEETLFFMAAGIRPVKNIGFSLDIFTAVRERFSTARLLLAGPVIDAAEAERIFEKGRSAPGFSYIGEISSAAAREVMAASDIYLNVSLHEGMSGAILEAMAEGLPVLASDAPGNRALVRHGVTGFLESFAEPDNFTAAATRLACDRQLRQAMSRAAVQAAAEFSVPREIERYEKLYGDILRSR
jgi:L-malate glycosyltransferase